MDAKEAICVLETELEVAKSRGLSEWHMSGYRYAIDLLRKAEQDALVRAKEGRMLRVAIGYIMTTKGNTDKTPEGVFDMLEEALNV